MQSYRFKKIEKMEFIENHSIHGLATHSRKKEKGHSGQKTYKERWQVVLIDRRQQTGSGDSLAYDHAAKPAV